MSCYSPYNSWQARNLPSAKHSTESKQQLLHLLRVTACLPHDPLQALVPPSGGALLDVPAPALKNLLLRDAVQPDVPGQVRHLGAQELYVRQGVRYFPADWDDGGYLRSVGAAHPRLHRCVLLVRVHSLQASPPIRLREGI